MGSKPMVALSIAKIPGQEGTLVLAMGGLDHKVHLYCGDSTGKVIYSSCLMHIIAYCIYYIHVFLPSSDYIKLSVPYSSVSSILYVERSH